MLDSETEDMVKKLTFSVLAKRAFETRARFASSSKVANQSGATIGVWDWRIRLQGQSDAVTCVALSTDGAEIFLSSGDCTVKVWSVTGGEAVETICFVVANGNR